MFDEPPPPPQTYDASGQVVTILGEPLPWPPRHECASYRIDPARPGEVLCEPFPLIQVPAEDLKVAIDLMQFAPPPPAEECTDAPADPLNSEIVVCADSGTSPRLGPTVGPMDEEFGSAIPRARIKLSESAEAEANATAPAVGGINAQGGEVRLKIDF